MQKFAYFRICDRIFQHFCAFCPTSIHVHASFTQHISVMLNICSIYICRIFQRIFCQIPHIFPAYFAPKRPAYFKKIFRYKPVSLIEFADCCDDRSYKCVLQIKRQQEGAKKQMSTFNGRPTATVAILSDVLL